MADGLYRVVFSGEILEGHDLAGVKRRLAELYRVDPPEADRLFTGRPVLVRNGVDSIAAEKCRAAFERAGALCRVEPLKGAPSQPAVGAAAAEHTRGKARGITLSHQPMTVSPKVVMGALTYSPMNCPLISGLEGGINLNRSDMGGVPFEDIRLLSAFSSAEGGKTAQRILIFLKDRPRPFVLSSSEVRYADFPGVSGGGHLSCIRNFVAFLCNRNPRIIMDKGTLEFVMGGQPVLLERDETALSAALAKALTSGGGEEKGVAVPPVAAVEIPLELPLPETAPAGAEEEVLAVFTGRNHERYLLRFRKFMSRGGGEGFKATWHWPAFLFPYIWMVYRKLYLWALAAFFLELIPPLGVPARIVWGLTGNYLYFRRARRRIREAQAAPKKASDLPRRLALAGGVNRKAVLSILTVIAGSILLAVISLKVIPSYMAHKRAVEADELARTELKEACMLAMKYSIKHTEEFITVKKLKALGYTPPQEVDLTVLDGRWDNLRMRARHWGGSSTYLADKYCYITGQEN